jgi:hypothetical protein
MCSLLRRDLGVLLSQFAIIRVNDNYTISFGKRGILKATPEKAMFTISKLLLSNSVRIGILENL